MALKHRGKLRSALIVVGSAVPAIADGARGLWSSESGRKWLVPLVIFLCATGVLLALAAGVEALAPFVYAIF